MTLTSALSAITAAVVGVILNLALFFGLHVFFPPQGKVALANLDGAALSIALVSFIGLLRWKWDILRIVVGGIVVGLAYKVILGM